MTFFAWTNKRQSQTDDFVLVFEYHRRGAVEKRQPVDGAVISSVGGSIVCDVFNKATKKEEVVVTCRIVRHNHQWKLPVIPITAPGEITTLQNIGATGNSCEWDVNQVGGVELYANNDKTYRGNDVT